ncbi:MAG: alanyl-tRNA editing protein [Gemmatimonadales bacterium]
MPPIEVARRYYHDSYLTRFRAHALEAEAVEHGVAVVLDETCFYPTSGGQPHDLGTLGGRPVRDVSVRERDGAVVHLVDGPVALGPVGGEVDWARRLDHMQQHTGQHILSQAFIRVADAATIGFHLGIDYVSIDLDAAAVDDATRERAFAIANDAVAADLEVRAWFPTPAELAGITLRKTPDVEGALRIVAIGDFDVSACGGTHVRRTGEVGLIHWLRSEKLKRGTRVSFLAGRRARDDYAAKQKIVAQVSAALSCAVPEIPEAVERLQGELQSARRELRGHQEAALDREAEVLRAEAAGGRLVQRAWSGRSAEEIRGLALRLTAAPGIVALLAGGAERTQFVFARSEDLATDLRPALDAALAVIGGGKGGGGRVVQGGGAAVDADTVARALAAAAEAVGL